MSEYQYYEFQAIDRPLTVKEMSELRSCSSRARITPSRFVNDYSWGNFKGDEEMWMEKYFDAFLYFANWGTRILKLRVPSRLLSLAKAEPYCSGESVSVREKEGRLIFSFISEDEDGYEEDWAENGFLASIIPVRAALMHGDLRALYLGWLFCAQNGDFDGLALEPPVPPGLGELSDSLDSLTGFLRLDPDLVHIAAQASGHAEDTRPKPGELRAWLAKLPETEKDEMLVKCITSKDSLYAAEIQQRFLGDRSVAAVDAPQEKRRTVDELFEAAGTYATERMRVEKEKQAEEKKRRDAEAAAARARYLDGLAGKEQKIWDEIDALISTTQPKNYDHAVSLLKDMRDLFLRRNNSPAFTARLEALRAAHLRKPTFIERIGKAGL